MDRGEQQPSRMSGIERRARDFEFLLLDGSAWASPRDGFAFRENIFCVRVPVERLNIGWPVKLAVRKLVCGERKMNGVR